MADPDGWSGNYAVAYWDQRWKAIYIYQKESMLNKVLEDGYDGVYLDWIEAYHQPRIQKAARRLKKDAAKEMLQFIREIREYARKKRAGFLIVGQNGIELVNDAPEYLALIDGIAQERIFFDGKADSKWSDPASCDHAVPALGRHGSKYYIDLLKHYQRACLPVFNIEYICSKKNALKVYRRSRALGYKTYISRRPLDRLTNISAPDPR
jgi:cysteinyl-tRNA synthetase